jgi:hypothetical protein
MDIVKLAFTNGSKDDRSVLTKSYLENIIGILLADKGYISKLLKEKLKKWGIDLLTHARKNMKSIFLTIEQKKLLSNRQKIEAVNGVAKNCYNLVNKRSKSILGFVRHAISSLTAYSVDKIFRDHALDDVFKFVDTHLYVQNA